MYTPLGTITLASASSSVTFSSIPQNYGDLILKFKQFNSGDPVRAVVTFNGDTSSNYFLVYLDSPNTSGVNSARTNMSLAYYNGGSDSNRPNASTLQIFDYSATDRYKTALLFGGNSNDRTSAYGERWNNTAAINNLTVAIDQGNDFLAGTTISLYGVEK